MNKNTPTPKTEQPRRVLGRTLARVATPTENAQVAGSFDYPTSDDGPK